MVPRPDGWGIIGSGGVVMTINKGQTVDCLVSWLKTTAPDEPAWRSEEPTAKQLAYLKSLGHKGQTPTTKGEASDLIDGLQPNCHYCGQPATGFDFFNAPVCRQCGGR